MKNRKGFKKKKNKIVFTCRNGKIAKSCIQDNIYIVFMDARRTYLCNINLIACSNHKITQA